MAAGVGLASLVDTSDALAQVRRAKPRFGTEPTRSGLLSSADFRYLGSFKVPAGEIGQTLYYSQGCFALRRGLDGGGPLTFLMSGPRQSVSGWTTAPMVREFDYPGESLSQPPVASTVRDWQDIWGGKQSGRAVLRTPTDGAPMLWGLWYDQTTNLLWWTYQTPYNMDHNPSLGCAALNGDGSTAAYGPWRTAVHSGKTGGFLLPIPPSFRAYVGGRTHVVGSAPHVQNGVTGFGAQLHAISLPDKTTLPDATFDERAAITVQTLLDYDIRHPQPRDVSGLRLCQWNCTTHPQSDCQGIYDSAKGGTLTTPAPFFSGSNPGGSYLLDWMDTCCWIDTGSRRGIIQFGQLVDTIPGHVYEDGGGICHNWYGPGTCAHGQVDASHPATGPGAGSLASTVWIWDPDDLVAVAMGHAAPYTALPRTTCLVTELAGAGSIGAGISGTGGKYRWGQSHYDPVTGKLFVSEPNHDKYGCCTFVPRMHVFQVAQA
jgi:hypothetical protein